MTRDDRTKVNSNLLRNIDSFFNDIDRIIELKVDFSGYYTRPISELDTNPTTNGRHKVKKRLSSTSKTIGKYFEYVHRWFPANPNKKDVVDIGNELYIDELTKRLSYKEYGEEELVNFFTNPEEKLNSNKIFAIEKIIKENRHIIVKGNKGIGKTTFFNYWLNNRSKYYETNLNRIWFRVDASKLYGVWHLMKDTKKVNLDLYHKAHAVYVTCKYGDSDKSPALYGAWHEVLNAVNNDTKLSKDIKGLEKAIQETDAAPDGKDTERFFSWVINNNRYTLIKRIYNICHKYWKDNNIKILFIVDGIDNISVTRNNIKHYETLCEQVGELFINDYRIAFCDDFSNIVIVIRPETYEDIKHFAGIDHLNTNDVFEPYECRVAPTCTQEILKHKSQLLLDPSSVFLKKFKDNVSKVVTVELLDTKESATKLIRQEIKTFIKLSDIYIAGLMASFRRKYKRLEKFYEGKTRNTIFNASDFEDISQIIEIIFNDNIRACVDNFIENHSTIILAKEKRIPGAQRADRYAQYLLLNGRMFLDSPDITTRFRGEAYPNIFWWDDDWILKNTTQWHGMCITRMLQLLNIRSEIRLDLYKELLTNLFDYPSELIDRNIGRIIKYGLIEYKKSTITEKNPKIKSTKKGKFTLEYTFMFTDWMYFSALDAPLENSFCRVTDSRYIKIHRDLDYNFLTTFNAAFITTITTFVRHVFSQQTIDNAKIKKNWKEYTLLKHGVFRNLDHALETFEIPPHFKFLLQRDLKSSFLSLYRRNKDEASELYKDLVGLYGK